MLQLTNPAWWYTLASLVLGALGVTDTNLQGDVKSVITGAVGIVVAVYTHEHHKTIRNADTAAATIKTAQAMPAPFVTGVAVPAQKP